MTVGDLDVFAAILAHQVVMIHTRLAIFKLLFSIAGADRRDEANALEPLQRTVHSSDIDVWLHGHNCSMNLLSGDMLSMRFDHLQHLEALWRQAMPLSTKKDSFFEMLHSHSLIHRRGDCVS